MAAKSGEHRSDLNPSTTLNRRKRVRPLTPGWVSDHSRKKGVAMCQHMRQFAATAMIAIATTSLAIAGDDDPLPVRDAYVVTALTSNLAGHAAVRDPVLQNAWGIAFSPAGSPFWINDNATGCATLYDGTGAKITALQVSIPLPGNFVPATFLSRAERRDQRAIRHDHTRVFTPLTLIAR